MDGWNALADPTRRAILERIAAHPSSVRDLAESLPVSRPAVSQHLKILKDAGLVSDRADGVRRVYRVIPAGLAAIHAQQSQFWTLAFASFQELANTKDH